MYAPNRILKTKCVVTNGSDAVVSRSVWVPFSLDLADVVGIRAFYDFETDELSASKTYVDLPGGDYRLVRLPYGVLHEKWSAWRTHADALRRLTN